MFAPSAPLIAELARLCAAELACRPFLTFDLEIAADAVTLEIDAASGSDQAVAEFFNQIWPPDDDGEPPGPAQGPDRDGLVGAGRAVRRRPAR